METMANSVISLGGYHLVYNAFSFTIAVMGAATLFFWLNRSHVAPHYRTAITISGLVTVIAFYHYIRIFNSWESAFVVNGNSITAGAVPFNDAYRYVDWLLTVPLLLIELILVMRLPAAETRRTATTLGVLAALMVIAGYPGEISQDQGTRWLWWAVAMVPFLVIVYKLFVGLSDSLGKQPAEARGLVGTARNLTVVSWCFYPIVFALPMLGLSGPSTTAAVQVGYTIADIVAKAVFGVLIYQIAVRKSAAEGYVNGGRQGIQAAE